VDGMADVFTRLIRVQGPVRGLQRMVREEAPGAKILIQVGATRGHCVQSPWSFRPALRAGRPAARPAPIDATRAHGLTSNGPLPGCHRT
jgi:hypothetical protein